MRHPFAGIMIPESDSDSSSGSDRRTMLKMLAAGAAASGLVCGNELLAEDNAKTKADVANAETKNRAYNLYLVIPKDFRRFTPQKRGELDVLGPFYSVRAKDHELNGKKGYIAWAAADHVEVLRKSEDVDSVHPFSGLVTETGRPSKSLMVMLSPNSWRSKPDRETYESAEDIAKAWSAEFKDDKVKIQPDRGNRYIQIRLSDDADEMLLATIRRHPQVQQIVWQGAITTLAVGEEGGGATTLAVGEEGGRPSTRALGEEGGRPRPTTKRLGEEGGKPTTEAVGEEGGRPRPTTLALGEEGGGGRVTTQALGEEGGRK